MTYQVTNPILFITFIKFDTAFAVLEKIREACPKKLYIASDGGRNPEEQQTILDFREKLLQQIDWECEIHTLFEAKNNGCKYGPYNAITWFFDHEEQGIILEDDCLPDNSFFRFCDELLEKFKNNEQVFLISGLNFCEDYTKNLDTSYVFSKIAHTNGWASWKRAWKSVAMEFNNFSYEFSDFSKELFHSPEEEKYWKKIFERWKNRGFDQAWDYQWLFHIWANHGVGVYPSINMIKNIGLDHNNATHHISDKRFLNMQKRAITFPLKHPTIIERHIDLEKQDYKNAFKTPCLQRIKDLLLKPKGILKWTKL